MTEHGYYVKMARGATSSVFLSIFCHWRNQLSNPAPGIEEIIQRITKPVAKGPALLPQLELRFRAIEELVDAYIEATSEQRQTIYRLANKCLDQLWVWSIDAAADGAQHKDLEMVLKGFIALGLEDLRVDERDTLRALSTLFHSVNKLGGSEEEMLQRALPLVSARFGECLLAFQARPSEHKSIKLMGFREGEVDGHFCYAQTNPF